MILLMRELLRPAVTLFILLSVITGIFYPVAVTEFAQIFLAVPASGSLIYQEGHLVGSQWIGQSFTEPKYFWGRPSATSPYPYNAAASGGSNQGPLNPDLMGAVKERVKLWRGGGYDAHLPIPAELVTASASGLDPHISPEAAYYQAKRIARVRDIPYQQVMDLIKEHIQARQWGIFGMPRVNVLQLNLALNHLKS